MFYAKYPLAVSLAALAFTQHALAADTPAAPECAQYEKLLTRAEVAFKNVSICSRIKPDLWGLRKELAEHGIGITATSYNGYTYDVLGNNAKKQVYNGQNPSYNTSVNLYLTYDLTRIGFANDAQLTLAGTWADATYTPANMRVKTVSVFAINQSFFNHRVELVYGYISGVRLFYGMALGGNASTAALGPSSVVPFQVGMSATEPTPTVNVIVRDESLRFYNSTALTRSVSPQGIQKDIDLNPSGLRLKVPEARALLINEVGYKQATSATTNAMWLRAGAMYNTSHYTEFLSGEKSDNNYGGYLAGTVQISKPFNDARGWYLDSKLDYSPDSVNAINKAFQVSAFNIGPFASRPADMAAVGLTKSYYSEDLRKATTRYGLEAAPYTLAVTTSYAARLFPGVYLISGLTYTKNPVFTPLHSDALLLQETLNFLF
ncbi:carbohydrate porin [Pseudomonas helleri]|uniref:Porin n=1 Tax=Pseudomonas helleri TaxID=1608996 RepID=A0A6A7YQY5_9PSED|nr:carbohydrate porin [Pseudomonas helleri]MQT28745.1 porin [Pseudomonas helleri]MQT78863.1 porin [Pseudomonas helleri]MQU14977.1 porin [Pseudomonas helleri]MQU27099.1 porin [Pseudomonas helleri]